MSINYVNKARKEEGKGQRERDGGGGVSERGSVRGRGSSGTSVNEGKQLEQVLRASAYKYSS